MILKLLFIFKIMILSVKCNLPLHHHYVSKCCPETEFLDLKTLTCKQTTQNITSMILDYTRNFTDFTITQGDFTKCSGGEIQHLKIKYLTTDGRVNVEDNSSISGHSDLLHYTCVDLTNENWLEAIFCEKVGDLGCLEETCLQKCCPFGQVIGSGGCEEIETDIELVNLSTLYQSNHSQLMLFDEKRTRVKTNMLQLIMNQQSNRSQLTCHDLYVLEAGQDDFKILQTGKLQENDQETDVYCLEYSVDNTTSYINTYRCIEEMFEYEEDIPKTKPTSPVKRYLRIVYICLISTSLAAILATLTVYLIVPDLRNLHGYIIISNLIAIGLASVYFIAVFSLPQVKTVVNDDDEKKIDSFCVGIGFFGYFSVMSMMVWMTTMCWDLCWTFTRAKIPSKTADKKKFIIYSIVSWGLPMLGACILGICQVYIPPESGINPRIGHFPGECFVPEEGNRIRYHVYLPILILLGVNLVLFLSIIISIIISKKKTSGIRTSTRKDFEKPESRINKRTKEQLKLYMKLFLVVGLLWIGEVAHHFHHRQDGQNLNQTIKGDITEYNDVSVVKSSKSCSDSLMSEVIYRIVDCLNLLRGVFLFIIFVCKKNVLKKLKVVFNGPKRKRLGSAFDTLRSSLSSKLSQPGGGLRRESTKNKSCVPTIAGTSTEPTKIQMNRIELQEQQINVIQKNFNEEEIKQDKYVEKLEYL